MNVVLLAVIGLVLLAGLVAVLVGNRGWSWGTVVAAVLLMLSAAGYLYLAARLAERERSWRAKVSRNETEIARIRDGAGGKGSLASLRTQRSRWTRALEFVDTWHGRSWKAPRFSPPRGARPGAISMEMPNDESDVVPLNKGAEVAVFDGATVENQGRFLGIFRVQDAVANKGAADCLVTVVPADAPSPPTKADTDLWARDYEDVTVYESLPVDRWLAFYRIVDDAAGEGAAAGAARWMPQPRKVPADDTLRSLERQMEAVQQHDEEIAEEKWPEIAAQLKAGDIAPGSHWATLEFTENVRFTRKKGKGAFALEEDAAPAEAPPAVPPGDDDGGPVGAPGEMVEPGAMLEPGAMIESDDDAEPEEEAGDPGRDATIESPAGVITKRFKEKRFEKGSESEFDLQTALELQDDRQWGRIKRVRYRRPLTDPFTALRGGEFKAADGKPLQSEGLYAIRQGLLDEIAALEQGTARVQRARENVDAQGAATAEEKTQLDAELESWQRDVKAAEDVAKAFDDRLRAATLELAALETAIVRLGRELDGSTATLTRSIDAATR
jgi:hypothetical protein